MWAKRRFPILLCFSIARCRNRVFRFNISFLFYHFGIVRNALDFFFLFFGHKHPAEEDIGTKV